MILMGERIKELRRRDGRTQEALAGALGVTAQAVSRWEKGVCCPDLELIPSIANYFGVSIDELFGYDNERTKKVDALYQRITELNAANNGEDVCMDECIKLARAALIEFPSNEKLTAALASALYNAGYVRYGEHHTEDAEGFSVYDSARNSLCPEWQEAIKLYEKLLPALGSGELYHKAVLELSQLYKNVGEHEKALLLADSAPELAGSRPLLRIKAYDGRQAAAASGEALIETLLCSAKLMCDIVRADPGIPPREAARLLENAAGLFGLVFTDGNYGRLNGFIACISMLRSYYLWLMGERDGAFAALGTALDCAKELDAAYKKGTESYSSPLLRHIKGKELPNEGAFAPQLPLLWPWWEVPQRDRVKEEMQSDPRWSEWEKRAEG